MERNAATHLPPSTTVPPRPAPDVDVAMLRAVRAFLLDDDAIRAIDGDDDELPGYASSSSRSDSSASASTHQSPIVQRTTTAEAPAPARPRQTNHSRVRMKNEVALLRQKAIALERRLSEIQSGDGASSDPHAHSETTHDNMWKTVALHQRERVTAAETERETLRAKVAHYKMVVQHMRRTLKRQAQRQPKQLKQLKQPVELPLDIKRHAATHDSDLDGFEDLSAYLQSMYVQLDSVFQDARLDSVTEQLQDVRIQNDDTLDLSFQLISSRLLPFDVDTTARAVWYYHTAKAAEAAVRVDVDDTEPLDSENVLRRSFVSVISFPNYKGRAHGRWEARRYVEKDRAIILDCSIFHRLEKSEGAVMDGFGMRVLNWSIISPPRGQHLRSLGRPVSHVDEFEVVVPFSPDGDTARYNTPEHRDELKTFWLQLIEYAHAFERQTVENILLSGVMD